MKKLIFTLLAVFAVIITSAPAAVISFSGPVDAMNTSVLDVELSNPNYAFVEGVTYGSGAKTFTTAGGNTITLAGNNANLGNADMPAATPSATSGWYNGGLQWNNSLLAGSTDVLEWTDSLKGNLWHNNVSDATRPLTLHLAGLTVGQTYEVQLYSADARYTDRQQAYASSFSGGVFSDTSVSFSQNPAYKVTGTFVADAAYQDIFLQETDGIQNDDTTLAVYTLYAVSANANNPDPYNGELNVDIAKILSWDAPSDPNLDPAYTITYDVYVDPNATIAASGIGCSYSSTGQTGTTFDPIPDLNYETSYYWKVDSHVKYDYLTEPNVLSGPVWSFTTVPESPLITVQPDPTYIAVDAGEPSVVLTANGINGSPQWYKDGSPIADAVGVYAGTTTGTLTIYDVQLADEGLYTFHVESVLGDAISDPVRVMIHRQTSYYDFESTSVVDGNDVYVDSIDGYHAVVMQESASAGLPTSVTDANGIAGLGAYLYLDNADHATDPNGQYLQVYPGVVDYEDITISLWVHPNGGNEWQRVLDFGAGTTDYLFLTPDAGGSGGLRYATRINNGGEQQLNTGSLAPGSWYYVTVAIGENTGKLYVNGEWRATNTNLALNPIDVGAVLNYIGKSQYPDAEFNGYIDDLKIYNYARTNQQIAEDYMAVSGVSNVCDAEAVDLGDYDADGDCKISLPDFAAFAARWLETDQFLAP